MVFGNSPSYIEGFFANKKTPFFEALARYLDNFIPVFRNFYYRFPGR